jgi:hypothetical protein
MTLGRWLSLAVVVALAFSRLVHGSLLGSFAFLCFIGLALIWFPEEINEYTLGLWYAGYKIETPTPAWLIATAGWSVLAGLAWLTFRSMT